MTGVGPVNSIEGFGVGSWHSGNDASSKVTFGRGVQLFIQDSKKQADSF